MPRPPVHDPPNTSRGLRRPLSPSPSVAHRPPLTSLPTPTNRPWINLLLHQPRLLVPRLADPLPQLIIDKVQLPPHRHPPIHDPTLHHTAKVYGTAPRRLQRQRQPRRHQPVPLSFLPKPQQGHHPWILDQ